MISECYNVQYIPREGNKVSRCHHFSSAGGFGCNKKTFGGHHVTGSLIAHTCRACVVERFLCTIFHDFSEKRKKNPRQRCVRDIRALNISSCTVARCSQDKISFGRPRHFVKVLCFRQSALKYFSDFLVLKCDQSINFYNLQSFTSFFFLSRLLIFCFRSTYEYL